VGDSEEEGTCQLAGGEGILSGGGWTRPLVRINPWGRVGGYIKGGI